MDYEIKVKELLNFQHKFTGKKEKQKRGNDYDRFKIYCQKHQRPQRIGSGT
jgi:hypothetical protein